VLPPPLSEFVILLVSRQWTQQYEWSQHDPIALKAGISTEIVTAISEGRRPSGMSEEQQILYDFCTEVQRNQSVSDSTYAKAVAKLGEPGVIDTLGLMGYYTMLAMVLNTSRTPPDKGAPTLEHFPR
jgi:4-carboxymuconolactone decarboxylase